MCEEVYFSALLILWPPSYTPSYCLRSAGPRSPPSLPISSGFSVSGQPSEIRALGFCWEELVMRSPPFWKIPRSHLAPLLFSSRCVHDGGSVGGTTGRGSAARTRRRRGAAPAQCTGGTKGKDPAVLTEFGTCQPLSGDQLPALDLCQDEACF